MLSAVIIILREILEAALIISVLLSMARVYCLDMRWFFYALALGVLGAAIFANYFDFVSEWFDGVGQEVINAIMLFVVAFLITVYAMLVAKLSELNGFSERSKKLFFIISILIVAVSLMREMTEIIIYGSGYTADLDLFQPVLIGGTIGAGIGVSIGALIYYFLVNLPYSLMVKISLALLVFVSAGLISQAALYLIQADWLPAQLPLWDTSFLLSEQSLPGQLLYSLIGYEATPTALQVSLYVATLLVIGAAIGLSKK